MDPKVQRIRANTPPIFTERIKGIGAKTLAIIKEVANQSCWREIDLRRFTYGRTLKNESWFYKKWKGIKVGGQENEAGIFHKRTVINFHTFSQVIGSLQGVRIPENHLGK